VRAKEEIALGGFFQASEASTGTQPIRKINSAQQWYPAMSPSVLRSSRQPIFEARDAEARPKATCGYHCWAEFYLAGIGWFRGRFRSWKNPAKRDFFFGRTHQRVFFTYGRDIVSRRPKE